MDERAVGFLRALDEEFQPCYVLSTSWWWLMNDPTLQEALRRSGLGFVVDNLHSDPTTPKGSRSDKRWNEIKAWLDIHPEFADRFVVLDDHLSGTGLGIEQPTENLPFIVLCEVNRGLTEHEYVRLRVAFQLRIEHLKQSRLIIDDA